VNSDNPRPRSAIWYLLPIFLGFVGGTIMLFVLKNDHRDRAIHGFILGIILTLLPFVLPIVLLTLFSISIPSPPYIDENLFRA